MLLLQPDFYCPSRCAELIDSFHLAINMPLPVTGLIRRMRTRTEVYGRYFSRASLLEADGWLREIREQALRALRHFYDINYPLYVEFTLLTEMRPGDYHPLHADNERQDADGQWVPNHTPWRHYTAMLYLNTYQADYEGGLLRFPALEMEVVPQANLLVGFPCGSQYRHEVTPVQQGNRYTLSIWTSRYSRFAERWD